MRTSLVILLVLLSALPIRAADDGNAVAYAFTAADTVRTNLWIAQALMADIAREIVDTIPGPGQGVSLRSSDSHEAAPLLEAQLHRHILDGGNVAYLDESDLVDEEPVTPVDADYEIRYSFETLDMEYPRVGRKLGLWKSWVDREMSMSVMARVIELKTGRLLMDERLQRSFGDRLSSGHVERVDDLVYGFTSAEVAEGGLMSVMEELVVVGALTGLVAIYFANTGN